MVDPAPTRTEPEPEPDDRTLAEGAEGGPGRIGEPTRMHESARAGDAPSRPSGVSPPMVAGYEILGELGRGGMGVVYHARQVRLNRPCALKMILAGAHADAASAVRFLGEAEAVARLQHPNIVQIHHVGESDGLPFFELEYVAGGSLDRRLDGTPWPSRAAAELVGRLAMGAAEAHRSGIVHRDLKPSNVLMTVEGIPKLADFGLAKSLGIETGLTRTDSVLGSPSYMAPEQAEGHARDVGPAADTYALGAILYELLTGRPPFRGATVLDTLRQVKTADPVPPSRMVPALPRDVETIALKCLEKSPDRRYPSAAALADDIRRYLDGDSILARPAPAWERAARWVRRRPAIAAMASAVALLFLALLGLGAWSYARIDRALAESEASRRIALESGEKEVIARAKAERDRDDATRARNEALDETYHALVSETRALRLAREPGWRAEALENLRRLAAMPSTRRDPYRLRTEAVACLVELDARSLSTLDARALSATEGNDLGIWSIAFSPDGKALAINDEKNARVILRDIDGGRVIDRCPKASGLAPFAYRPDGTCLAIGVKGDRVEFRPSRPGAAVPPPILGPAPALALAFDSTGRRLAVAWGPTRPGPLGLPHVVDRIQVFDLPGGAPPWTISGPFDESYNYKVPLALSPDGSIVASVGPGHSPQLHRAGGDGRPAVLGRHRAHLEALRFSPDGAYLASGGRAPDPTVIVWDVARGREHLELHEPVTTVFDLAFSPDGELLASNGGEMIHLWDARSGRPRLAIPNRTRHLSIAFSPEGDRIAFGSTTGEIVQLDGRHERRQLPGHTNNVVAVAFHPGRPELTSVGTEVLTWDLASRRPRQASLPASWALSVAYSPDGRWLSVGFDNRVRGSTTARIRVWDDTLRVPPRSFPGIEFGVTALAFDRQGRRLAAGASGGRTIVYDVATGNVVRMEGTGSRVHSVALLSGGSRLLAGNQEGRAILRDLDGPGPGREALIAGPCRRIAVAPDEGSFASAGQDGSLKVASLPGLEVLRSAEKAHDGPVVAIAISPDGRLLASAGTDHRVVIRDLGDLRPLFEVAVPTQVTDLAFHPDGRSLAACGMSEQLAVWDLALIRGELASIGLDRDLPPATPGPVGEVARVEAIPEDERAALRSLDATPGGQAVWSERSRFCNRLTPDRSLVGRLLARRPDEPLLWYAAGLDKARRREWAEAAADFERGGDLGSTTEYAFDHACLRILSGDIEGYRRSVAKMARADGEITDPYRSFVLARSATMAIGAEIAGDLPVRWARQAVAGDRRPWTLHTLGMACHRAGRDPEAVRWLEASERAGGWGGQNGLNGLGLALVRHRLGESAEARRRLDRAARLLDRTTPGIAFEAGTLPMQDWLEAQVLRREAERLILDAPFPADPFAP